MQRISYVMIVVLVLALLSGCNTMINKSVNINDGKKVTHGYNSINGNLTIGDDCLVKGNCRSVNGRIRVGSGTETSDLQSVNGSITIGEKSHIHGGVHSINGAVECGEGVIVERGISAVNGDIELDNTKVEKDVKTYNGDVTLANKSEILGDIIVKRSKGSRNKKRRTIYIRLRGASVVHGDVINHERDYDVQLILSDGSKVKGSVKNVEVIEN